LLGQAEREYEKVKTPEHLAYRAKILATVGDEFLFAREAARLNGA
jgi:hypothetical protein